MAKYFIKGDDGRADFDDEVINFGSYGEEVTAKHAKNRDVRYYDTKEGIRWREYKRQKNKGLTIARFNKSTGDYTIIEENVEAVKDKFKAMLDDGEISKAEYERMLARAEVAVEAIKSGAYYSTQGHYGYDAEGDELHFMNIIDEASFLSRMQTNYQLKMIQNLGYTAEELANELNKKYHLTGDNMVTIEDLLLNENWGTLKDDLDKHWSAAGFRLKTGDFVQINWSYNHQDTNTLISRKDIVNVK